MLRHQVLAAMSAVLLTTVPAAALAQDAGSGGEPAVSDHVVFSFDGTPLEVSLFVPAEADDGEVPLVLRTHGWGGTREREAGGTLDRLLDEGYAVLTWDSRGFGCSGGVVRIDDPDVEGRDVTALIDWAVGRVDVATDDDGDPIVGMTGGSYAGGIQMAAAAVDDRLDAFAPEIAWSDLRYSLDSGGVVNQGWVALLYSLGKATGETLGLDPQCLESPQIGGLDPAIDQGVAEFLTTGRTSQATRDFFAKSSLASYGQTRPTTVPTLVMQGSVDTLFDLTDGHGIFTHVRDQGVDARFIAFCGGHVACPASYTTVDDRAHLDDAIAAWFARYLKGENVDTGPTVEYRTNAAGFVSAPSFPPPTVGALDVAGAAEQLVAIPVVDLPDVEETFGALAGADGGIPGLPTTTATPSADDDPRAATFEVAGADDGDLEVVGFPEVTLTVDATTIPLEEALAPVSEGIESTGALEQAGELLIGNLTPVDGFLGGLFQADRIGGLADPQVHLHVKFVHREAGEILNLQEGSVAVPADDGPVTVDVPMPGLAYTLPQGDHLDVQVATHSLMHASGRVPALVDVELAGTLPVLGTGRASPSAETPEQTPAGEPAEDRAPDPDATGDDPVSATPAGTSRPLPVTGGGAIGPALAALLGAGLLRRREA